MAEIPSIRQLKKPWLDANQPLVINEAIHKEQRKKKINSNPFTGETIRIATQKLY